MTETPRELSALVAFTAAYPGEPCSQEEQLEKIRKFFISDDENAGRLLGTLLPGRLKWYKKYAAPYLTSEYARELAALIDRLAENEEYIAAEITAYQARHQLQELTFSDFAASFDKEGLPVKSIISNVLRNAARARARTLKKQGVKSK